MGSVVKQIRTFVVGTIGLFMAMGFLPVVVGAIVADLLGYKSFAEYLIVFGLGGWIAIRSVVGWHMLRTWRKSEELRVKEGRESAGDIRRREEWERKKLRRREYARETMRKRAESTRSENGKGSI